MKFATKMVGAAVLAGACLTTAHAVPYTSLVVFGDSLLDPGNAAALTQQADGTPFWPALGRFTNGPTAAELLAERIGSPTVPGWPNATSASNNFAVGGALSGNGNFNVLIDRPAGLGPQFPAVAATGIAQQIARYDPAGLDAQRTLFLLWGGANDLFLGFAQAQAGMSVDFTSLVAGVVRNIASDINQLVARGARNILVPSLPDLGLTPFGQAGGPSFAASASALTQAYNNGLDSLLGMADQALEPQGVNLYGFDTADYLRQTIAGDLFNNVTQSCVSGGAAALASQCAGYLFFDDVHPTAAANLLLADRFAESAHVNVSAVPEPQTWALMLVALGAVLGVTLRQRRQRAPADGAAHPPAEALSTRAIVAT